MKIFEKIADIQRDIDHHDTNKTIGFVPTMGALHEGHLTLIEEAKRIANIVVCSIFVNPTQFNDPKDLEKYPRPIERDLSLLRDAGCDIVFIPEVSEMYPEDEPKWHIDLGRLDQIWEGEHRPGHFQGVTQVVNKLFDIVKPDYAIFGQKDFQQVMVVQRLIETKHLPVQLHIAPTQRNNGGLALSSRNVRLSDEGKMKATAIYRVIDNVNKNIHEKPIPDLVNTGKLDLQEAGIEVEYLAVCETSTLEEVNEIDNQKDYVIIAAVWLEGIRLIDNLLVSAR